MTSGAGTLGACLGGGGDARLGKPYHGGTNALAVADCRGDCGAARPVVAGAGAGAGDGSADPLCRRLRDADRAGPVLGGCRAGVGAGWRGGAGVVAAVAP